MEKFAQIVKNEIPVVHSIKQDVGREFLSIKVEGWPDVQKISKKILEFEGRKFKFTGWNSDSLTCYFARPLTSEIQSAKIV
jgi:hypothetical protein